MYGLAEEGTQSQSPIHTPSHHYRKGTKEDVEKEVGLNHCRRSTTVAGYLLFGSMAWKDISSHLKGEAHRQKETKEILTNIRFTVLFPNQQTNTDCDRLFLSDLIPEHPARSPLSEDVESCWKVQETQWEYIQLLWLITGKLVSFSRLR